MASKKTNQELLITTRMKDLVSKEFRKIGKSGSVTAAKIAAGFIAAKVAIAGMRKAVRAVSNVIKGLTLVIAEQGDVIAKTSKRLGVAVETLSAFKHIAELSGSTFEAVGKGFKALAKNAVDFADGVGEAKLAFEELGIVVTTNSGDMRDLESIFLDTADALGKMEDTTKRAAHAQRIFGRAGLDLIPIFLEGKDGIIALREEAERLGIVWTEETALAAEVFNDSMLRMERSIDGVKLAIGQELLPVLSAAFDDITASIVENKDEIGAWARSFIDDAIPAIQEFGRTIVPIMVKVLEITTKATKELAGFAKFWISVGAALTGQPNPFKIDGKVDGGDSERARKARISARFAARRAEEELGIFPPTPFPSAGDMSAIRGLGLTAGLPPEPVEPPSPTLTKMTQEVKLWNFELVAAAENSDAFNRSTEAMDSTLTDLAESGLNATTSAFTSFFDSMVSGTANTADAFRGMVSDILSSLARLAFNQLFTQIAEAIFSAAGSTSTTATAKPVSFAKYGGEFADGGSVPGAPGSPQLILAHGGEHVLSRADLRGGRGGAITINQVINPSQGMDEVALGEFAAGAVSRAIRESQGFRRQIQGTARGGLI